MNIRNTMIQRRLWIGLLVGVSCLAQHADIDVIADITDRATAVPELGSVFLLATGLFVPLVLKRRERVLSLR